MEKNEFYLSLQHGLLGTRSLQRIGHFIKNSTNPIREFFALTPSGFQSAFGADRNEAFQKANERVSITREIARSQEEGIQIVTLEDSDYPESLKGIFNPPLAFYCQGTLAEDVVPRLAMVGTRRPSYYGIEMATSFARELARCGLTIVSGLARGIDTCAHEGALKGGGITYAVLGSGLLNVYPRENKSLVTRILQGQGCLISELPLEAEPLAFHFPMRNRIISGLARGVCVMEAAAKSGSLITASLALEEGREVYAVPGMARSLTSQGTIKLIQEGAKCAACAEDILEDYTSWLIQEKETASLR